MPSHLVRVTVLGTVVQIVSPTPLAADQIRQWWSRCLALNEVDADHTIVLPDTDLPLTEPLAQKLTHEVNLHAIEGGAGSLVMLHAGAVADAEGGTVGLIAESGVGKTTATVTLCRSGWGYVTDETLAIRLDGTVVPMAKPLALVSGELAKTIVGPDQLDLGHASGALRLRRLVLLDRDPTHVGSPTMVDVPLLAAVEALVGHSSALVSLHRPLQSLAHLVSQTGGLLKVSYRESEDLVPGLQEVLSGRMEHDPRAMWWPDPIGPPAWLPLLGPHVSDAIGTPDGVLMMCGLRPVRLSAVGVLIWGYAAAGRSTTETVSALAPLASDSSALESVVRDTVGALRVVGALRFD